jgi:predicted DNA-binding protein YlxM (UPF0122 family)
MTTEKKSLFISFIGDSPTARIIDYLLTNRELDFSMTDIAKNSKVGRATLYRVWDDLIRNNVIMYTRTIGKAKLFRLNSGNIKIKKLIEIDNTLVIENLSNRSRKKKQVELSA